MKKFVKILSLVVMLVSALTLMACGKIELSFDEDSIELEFDGSQQLEYTISKEDVELVWSVSDDTIVKIDQNGFVKALKPGTVTVTVKVKDKDIEAKITVTVKEKPIINPTTVVIEGAPEDGKVGQSFTLTAKVLPVGADQSVTWSSEKTNVATVSDTGVVQLVGMGLAKIRATSTKDTTKFHEVEIVVSAPDPESITITSADNKTEVNVFDTLQFTATTSPDLASNDVTWSVSNDALATIDATGKLTAKAPGTVTITATSTVKETVSATFELVIVQPDPEEIKVTPESVTLGKGEEITLSATVLPAIAVQTVTFTSSDTDVVTVDGNGKVVAVGAGEATITVKSTAKETITTTVEIKVEDPDTIEYSKETILLDASITANRFEKITVDEKEYYVGLNAFTSAKEAFAALEENSKLIVKKGTYSEPTAVKVNGVQIIGPNAGKPAGKDLSNRVEEAVFSAIMTIDEVDGLLIDGIALTGAGQIKATKPIKNVIIQNINSYSPGVPASEGIVYAGVTNATDKNYNIIVQNSAFVDSTGAGPGAGYRGIRVNNPNNLIIRNNYLVGFYDTIRLEGEGNAGLGSGVGVTGDLVIYNNLFENNFQYPIWIGAFQGANMEITDNYIATREAYVGVYGYLYIAGFKEADTKSVINVLRNEMPYQVPGWHQIRFNTNGAKAEQLEINVNYNIFHENTVYPDGEYYHIADHFTNTTFVINGANNYYLYEGDVKAEWFLGTNYEPYFREPTIVSTNFLVDPNLEGETDDFVLVDGVYYKVGTTAFKTLADLSTKLVDGAVVKLKAGTYNEEFTVNKNDVTIIGPNKGIKADKALNGRLAEAEFTADIIISDVDGLTIDGIKLTGGAQIRAASPVKNVTIQNVYATAIDADPTQGLIFFALTNAADTNENIIIRDNHFADTVSKGYRAIRINNAKNIEIYDNYLYRFTDTIRLEGEGNAGLGAGVGVRGFLKIENNIFEDNLQYPIWIGALQAESVEINDNYLGIRKDYAGSNYGVYGYMYLAGFKAADAKTVVNVLRNEMPYQVPGWHQIRFNTNGLTAEQLEINVNYNIFHENTVYSDGEYYHIADHFTNTTFVINGTNNYYLYEGDVKAEWFLGTNYEPYFSTLETE
jgi:uncharacterized protein YjdB